MDATVTTVLPTYRRPRMLQRAIRSALAQTHSTLRVEVFDNASGDETERVVAEEAARDARVSYHLHAANIGSFENFLYGMQAVTTPYFSFLSDDDVLFPGFYQLALAALERQQDAMLFAGSVLEFNERGELLYAPLAYWPREGVYEPPEGALRSLGNRHPTWTGIVFRRQVIEQVGLLDREVGAPSDLDYVMRVAARFPIVVSFEPCAAYVSHPGSSSVNETVAVIPGYEKLTENMAGDERLARSVRDELRARLEAQTRGKLVEISVKALARGDRDASRDAALMLRDRYHARATANALLALRAACTGFPPLLAALRCAEQVRLRLRAGASRRRLRAQSQTIQTDLGAYARYVEAQPTA
jgi:glycosyltransferase involved in cell wall biosynthesis